MVNPPFVLLVFHNCDPLCQDLPYGGIQLYHHTHGLPLYNFLFWEKVLPFHLVHDNELQIKSLQKHLDFHEDILLLPRQ